MSDRIELLSPAGDLEKLQMSVAYGADAVYLAGTEFGMRSAAGNFNPEQLEQAVRLCHDHGVKVYVTCNTLPREDELVRLPEYLVFLNSVGVDALIIADIGVLSLAKKYAPDVKIHISTQFGVVNSMAASALYDMGADTVVLARELSLEEIRKIRENTPKELRLEAFVHGAMCVSFSGRCLLSNYLTGRDSNRGSCAQPCRWKYALCEETRPGEYFPISEEDNGTFILNSRDMCMIEHLKELTEAGVSSLKIEGRMKSAYYTAIVTSAYRHVLDSILKGNEPDNVWLNEVNMVSHRPYSTGFYYGYPGQHYSESSYTTGADVAAVVESCDDRGMAKLVQRNKFSRGDRLQLVTPESTPKTFTVDALYDEEGNSLDDVRHAAMKFTMMLPCNAPALSILRIVK